jgi:hypothetical protein
MSSFGEEIFKALTGRDHEPTSAAEMFEQVEDYRTEVGLSRRAFARQSGIPESTLRYWGTKGFTSKSDAANLSRLTVAFRGLIASPAALDAWRNNRMSINVSNVPGEKGRVESRSISAGQLGLGATTGESVVAHFLRGDDKGAAHAFVNGIGDGWYRKVMFKSWIGRHDDDLADLPHEDSSEYDGEDDYAVYATAS